MEGTTDHTTGGAQASETDTRDATRHLLDAAEEVIRDRGPVTAQELARELADRGDAYAVVGGTRMALSSVALDRRLSREMSGFQKTGGEWDVDGDVLSARAPAGAD